ncbi:MAG: LCP family protein [Sarcina sp.]
MGAIKISGNRQDRNKAKVGKGKKIIISIFLVILSLFIAGGAYVINLLGSIEQVSINEEELGISENLTEEQKKIRNIALFGIDSTGDTGRSDSIMILTLDEKHKKVKLTSIMRDSYVDINGKKDKINHAYAYGGPELAIKTINKNFGLNIKDFISVNFDSLGSIIDELGGVQLKVEANEVKHIPGISGPGVHNLTGSQALAYSRIRYEAGGDYQRTQRQRNIMQAIYESFRYTEITEYPGLITSFLPYVTSNMPATEMIGIGTEYGTIMSSGLDQYRFPRDGEGENKMINGTYYLAYDIDRAGDDMRKYIFDDERVPFENK